jgi:hypothetical protein
MLSVGFEPTIPAFKRATTVHALDSAATVIGCNVILFRENPTFRKNTFLGVRTTQRYIVDDRHETLKRNCSLVFVHAGDRT